MLRATILGKAAAAAAACLLLSYPTLAQEEAEVREQLEALRRGQEQLQMQIELMKEVQQLREGMAEIRKEIAEIKGLLQARPAAPARAAAEAATVENVAFDIGANPVRAERTAPLTLIEFTDYQCPYCGRHVRETGLKIEEEYVQSGRLRVVKLDLPLERIHPLAFKAAEAAHCAGDQGKFWEMHDRLFASQNALAPFSGHAEALGLDVPRFDECLSSGKYAGDVRKDMEQAQKAGATGTPSFVLGRTDPENPSAVKGITFLRGARAFADFKAEIDRALSEAGR